MRPLSPAEWDKPNSQTNEPRLSILKRLIQQKADIVTIDNETIKLAEANDVACATFPASGIVAVANEFAGRGSGG